MSNKIVRQNTTLSKTVYNQKVLIFQGFQAFEYGAGSSILCNENIIIKIRDNIFEVIL